MATATATQPSKFTWSELADDHDDGEDLDFLLPPTEVIGPDENGVKKVIEYKFNDEGKIVRTIRTIRIRKIPLQDAPKTSQGAIERRSWAAFGDAVNDHSNGRLTTISAEWYTIEPPVDPETMEEELISGRGTSLTLCRICGNRGEHWTAQCPNRNLAQPSDTFVAETSSPGTHTGSSGGATTSAYVPPSRGDTMRRRNEENGVRINNLPEETTKQDLQDLCSPFGQISRVWVATDRDTGLCRGFGTVNFVRRDDAEQAIMKLNNYGYDHLILKVEWDRHRAT